MRVTSVIILLGSGFPNRVTLLYRESTDGSNTTWHSLFAQRFLRTSHTSLKGLVRANESRPDAKCQLKDLQYSAIIRFVEYL